MPRKVLSIEQVLVILAEAPPRIATLTEGLSADQLSIRPAAEEWSANEVLAHLRACADMWGRAIQTILTQDEPTIRAVNPRTWIKETDYLEQEFQPSLHAFSNQRTELLAVLEALPREKWSKSATITGAGKPFKRTVQDYAEWLAEHERPHLKQIKTIVNTLQK